jgi:hypothetical protein
MFAAAPFAGVVARAYRHQQLPCAQLSGLLSICTSRAGASAIAAGRGRGGCQGSDVAPVNIRVKYSIQPSDWKIEQGAS